MKCALNPRKYAGNIAKNGLLSLSIRVLQINPNLTSPSNLQTQSFSFADDI
jgi:hypothetical protein